MEASQRSCGWEIILSVTHVHTVAHNGYALWTKATQSRAHSYACMRKSFSLPFYGNICVNCVVAEWISMFVQRMFHRAKGRKARNCEYERKKGTCACVRSPQSPPRFTPPLVRAGCRVTQVSNGSEHTHTYGGRTGRCSAGAKVNR